ncbi:lytic transglycosylase domain-containing protein [Actinoplanes sp. NPDC020271]|uniref:aggregation-promoting factor C-terminal-like domain-containing protein n=1 Tax=Actinoplanes sp. NPDC020271 TaxID=3363896 RepID=UPI0037A097D1
MNRLWSRLGVRTASVGLLVAGLGGGVYLGQDRDEQPQTSSAALVMQADAEEVALLKQRQNEHAADRAHRTSAENAAAGKAAAEAKTAATEAHTLTVKSIAAEAAKKKAAEEKAKEKAAASGAEVPYTGDIPSSCNEYSGTRGVGCALMLDAGFKIDQFPCLDKLWKRESGWNYKATNSSSGAYGIPQALPGSKMASIASDWKTNPATQIKWGLNYIEGRYSTPCGAWNHSESTGWY